MEKNSKLRKIEKIRRCGEKQQNRKGSKNGEKQVEIQNAKKWRKTPKFEKCLKIEENGEKQ